MWIAHWFAHRGGMRCDNQRRNGRPRVPRCGTVVAAVDRCAQASCGCSRIAQRCGSAEICFHRSARRVNIPTPAGSVCPVMSRRRLPVASGDLCNANVSECASPRPGGSFGFKLINVEAMSAGDGTYALGTGRLGSMSAPITLPAARACCPRPRRSSSRRSPYQENRYGCCQAHSRPCSHLRQNLTLNQIASRTRRSLCSRV